MIEREENILHKKQSTHYTTNGPLCTQQTAHSPHNKQFTLYTYTSFTTQITNCCILSSKHM